MSAISSEVTRWVHTPGEQSGYDTLIPNFLVTLTKPPICTHRLVLVVTHLEIPDYRNFRLKVWFVYGVVYCPDRASCIEA